MRDESGVLSYELPCHGAELIMRHMVKAFFGIAYV